MPKKRSKQTPTKSDVIRSMPTASATDIIKKAKSLGLKLNANHVYAVRAMDKRRGKPGRANKAAAAGAELRSAPSGRTGSKTAFIRGFSSDTPAATVVSEGKKVGIRLSKEYVYRVRALAKPRGGGGRGGRAALSGLGASDRDEQRFATLAMEIGLVRAAALLQRVRQRLLG